MQRKALKPGVVWGLVGLLAILLGFLLFGRSQPLPKAQLADGRILQVEGVSFGTKHAMGTDSFLRRFSPWLPAKVNQFFEPGMRRSEITLEEPGLVVWVNAIDPVTGKHVDCQGIGMEFVDQNGDCFGEATRSWFGGKSFWRVGHVFHAYPRAQRQLTLLVTPWKTNVTARLEFPNPHVTRPAAWSGNPLPQRKPVGDLEVILSSLTLRTNGGEYWQTPCSYWEPQWELRQGGQSAAGWDGPEWIAEDACGNRGQFLGTHQPVLRYSAKFYPSATNLSATRLLASSALTSLVPLQSNSWWNLRVAYGKSEIAVLGLFPAGVHVFCEGTYQTNPPVKMSPVRGGAPSGWVGQIQRISPTQSKIWNGHYTPMPVIYLRAPELANHERFGVRLRDEQGRYWLTKPEEQGHPQDIYAFLVKVPAEVTNITAEILVLRPVEAEFTVHQ